MTDRITLTPIWALMLLGHELSTGEAKSYGLHAIVAVVNDDECDTFQDVSYALGIRSVSAHTRRGHFTQMPMPRKTVRALFARMAKWKTRVRRPSRRGALDVMI